VKRVPTALVLHVAVFALLSCGARTGFDVYQSPDGESLAHGSSLLDGGSVLDGSIDGVADGTLHLRARFECPFPVLSGSPMPMFANCSTRDGRSRVVGPTSPQVTWSTMLPGSASVTAGVALVADTTGNVYATSSIANSAWMVRVEGATGVVDWSTPFSSDAIGAPVLLASGGLIDFAAPTLDGAVTDNLALLEFDTVSGNPASMTLAPIANGIGIPAIGADGSLYAAYASVETDQMTYGVIVRILPCGQIAWTSANLTPVMASGASGISTIAIGSGGLVLAGVDSADVGSGLIVALDPATGAMAWSTLLDDTPNGNPLVALDGSIVIASTAGTLFVLDGAGTVEQRISIGSGAFVTSIALDGTMIVAAQTALLAVTPTGSVAWQVPTQDFVSATLDAGGTVIATFRDHIEGRSLATGQVLWSVAAPSAVPCIGNIALTSTGGIVALGCVDFMGLDGEVFAFGASDG
jgi:PQQ-like domain